MIVSTRTGRPLAADEIVGRFGPGEAQYDEESGEVFYVGREGLLAEQVDGFIAAGGIVRPAAFGGGRAWAVLSDGRAVPVVCGEIIPVMTEDGPSDGRCGQNALGEGMCEGHAEEYAQWNRMAEVERAAWERDAADL